MRAAARLTALREAQVFAGDAERPADEWVAATPRGGRSVAAFVQPGGDCHHSGGGLDAQGCGPAGVSDDRRAGVARLRVANGGDALKGNDGTAAPLPRSAETEESRVPPRAVSAGHFAPPSSRATTASYFARQSASCS